MKHLLGVAAFISLAGCSNPGTLYPLKVGHQWSYQVRNGMAEFLQTVRVEREVPVAGVSGFELSGTMGESRLAWKGSQLVATVLPAMRLNPPLTLLDGANKKTEIEWLGTAFSNGKSERASAKLVQTSEIFKKGGREVKAIKTVLTMKLPTKTLEITTWYGSGIGPLSQVQRTRVGNNERFDVSLEHLSGP